MKNARGSSAEVRRDRAQYTAAEKSGAQNEPEKDVAHHQSGARLFQ
jgi:hypothetical protein